MTIAQHGAAPQLTPIQQVTLNLAQWCAQAFGLDGLDALIDGALFLMATVQPPPGAPPYPPHVLALIETAAATRRARHAARSAGIVLAPAGSHVNGVKLG